MLVVEHGDEAGRPAARADVALALGRVGRRRTASAPRRSGAGTSRRGGRCPCGRRAPWRRRRTRAAPRRAPSAPSKGSVGVTRIDYARAPGPPRRSGRCGPATASRGESALRDAASTSTAEQRAATAAAHDPARHARAALVGAVRPVDHQRRVARAASRDRHPARARCRAALGLLDARSGSWLPRPAAWQPPPAPPAGLRLARWRRFAARHRGERQRLALAAPSAPARSPRPASGRSSTSRRRCRRARCRPRR